MKEALMQDNKETLVEAFDMDFNSANAGIKSALFRFLEKALVGMMLRRTLDSTLAKTLHQPFHSDAFMSPLLKNDGAPSPP